MKKLIIMVLCCFAMQATAQNMQSAEEWQDDLKFLQNTIHSDYSFLFKKTTASDFDKSVSELSKAIPSLEEHEIIVGLARIISSFKYGHTALGFRSIPGKFHSLPLNLYYFKDGIYVQGVHKDYKQLLGAKVTAVAGVPVEDVLKAVYPVVPAENDQFFKAYGLRYMISPEILHAQGVIDKLSDNVELSLKKGTETFKQTVKVMSADERAPIKYGFVQQEGDWLDARKQDKTPLYLKNLDKIYYYEYLPEKKTVYVRHSQIQDDPSENIPDFYDRVFNFIANNDVERLVIDVRLNGGGNNYKNKAVITRIIESKKINQVGKLYVIIGRRTFSACQNLVNEFDNYTNAIFIGEPTGENINFYGDNRRVELPNSKIPMFLSFAWWQDKPQWENGPWTAPQIAVDMSFEDYKENRDPVLDASLSFSDSEYITDPMQYMTDLYLAGEMEKLQKEAVRMINDPAYQFFDFEGELNKTGYDMLGRGDHETAVAVFTFVTQLFPDSANAWDSLAEGYLKAGQKEKAIEYYRKALSMDPEGATGKNASEMLKEITKEQ
ncbi:tetratricopeptide repeat protein [Leptobacterium flavescens]|uniref:Tetratricopeptide repeat protein n=1 Tax=Leptobacterium flavescens TaxID=472055 RepID=A0A6P0URH6_9FLAO|nr:S41 family peptidase [Leptobacterium flavescens]NER13463.1 tetratricopeptide repeat protein [Leptobacterium flavescens]